MAKAFLEWTGGQEEFMSLDSLFYSKPFETRNGEDHPITDVLNLYVNPIDGLDSPFDFKNVIIKGRMGSGKTMY
jgi:hypothetical protein